MLPRSDKDLLLWAREFITLVGDAFRSHSFALNGNLGFGDGTFYDNIKGKWVEYTTNATPDTEDTVVHDLGVIPAGFLVMLPPKSGYLYNGSTTWTTTNLYLKCSAASQTVRIFVVPPSTQT